MKNILVTGANGQLGACFKKISGNYSELNFHFKSSSEADITDKYKLEKLFSEVNFDWVINCAAYTNVEKAESEDENSFKINAEGAKNIAELCAENQAILIHFSTDYVFDGKAGTPYQETDKTNPINVYGASKLKGEQLIAEVLKEHFIFRTSWLYSEFRHNFYKTILRKIEEKAELNITTSQTGTPTNANDLAEFVLEIIASEDKNFGLYHFSNLGEATWYSFANAILEFTGNSEEIRLNESNDFKTIAARPEYSVLDKTKIQQKFQKKIPEWKMSLKTLILS
ncbi:dTDP-4-dehydrorhamnose reductase [Salegentibacter salegens]|uniref:dTDP-4-dehydrorhamnose reductase n=1 Tax=Salegentibacter salegens TaxID=143223 RepID=A0A1M7MA35_9FLAO|nr:dTDP-4-dehydrorhamnose reductase [Salegentibacter salegens]PRX51571.1 dTDP-4-dehydrorhamnose reductase [Salegentibacter salegens]SHM87549.1 dTDP-4-dehydrorhamnose reductase [Salegentibacter salegens]